MTPTSPASPAGTRPLAWAVLAASVLQVVAPVVTIAGPGASPASGSGPELLIAPAGWAFSIWGVIYALAVAQAVSALRAGPGGIPRRLQVDQVVLYAGGAVWIAMAAVDSSVATALALALMLAAAADGVLTATRHTSSPTWLATLTRAAIGLYAGWVTAAFFLNLATALVEAGLVEADRPAWQLGLLVVAALTLLALVVATHGSIAFTAAGAWALVGIAVTGSANGDTTVLVLALVGAVVLVAATVALRLARGAARAGARGSRT